MMGDGTVRFVNENINSSTAYASGPIQGDANIPPDFNMSSVAIPNGGSPYGIWGNIGTMAGGETVSDF